MQKEGFRSVISLEKDRNLSETQHSSHTRRLCVGFRCILCTLTSYRKAELSFEVEQDLVVDRSTQPTVLRGILLRNHGFGFHEKSSPKFVTYLLLMSVYVLKYGKQVRRMSAGRIADSNRKRRNRVLRKKLGFVTPFFRADSTAQRSERKRKH